ncbi:MAG: hypothetical protein ACTHMI_13415 [Mucilaginibacter sp.]
MNATNQTIDAAKPLWEIAQSKENTNRKQKLNNRITRREYFSALERIKELCQPLEDWAFERDYTTQPSDKATPIHCFLNNEIYWHLTCDEQYNFTILYNVADDKLQTEVNCLIYLMSKSTRWQPSTELDVPTLFKRCKRIQPNKYFSILK